MTVLIVIEWLKNIKFKTFDIFCTERKTLK